MEFPGKKLATLRSPVEKYRSSMPPSASPNDFVTTRSEYPTPCRTNLAEPRHVASARASYQTGRVSKSLENKQRDLFAARDAGQENAHTAVFPAARAGGIQVVGVSRVHIYLVRDISQLLTILRLESLLDLLAAPHHRLVQLLLHDVTAISGHSTTCRRPPVDLLRLIPGRASLNTGSRTS